MKVKHKAVIASLIILVCGYLLWTQRPVTIFRAGIQFEYDPTFFHGLYVSSKRGFIDKEWYDIAVDHMALTEWGGFTGTWTIKLNSRRNTVYQ